MAVRKQLSLEEYQEKAMRTAGIYDTVTDELLNGLMGLNGEAGEALDILKKHLFQGHELDQEHIKKELGDCLWYIALAADSLGVSLEEIAIKNIEKLEKRYPTGFNAELSINRKEGDI